MANNKATTTMKRTTKGGNAGAALPLRWSATEYVPQRRWWWFVGLTLISSWLGILALAFGDWSGAALVFVITVTYFVLLLPKPRVWHYTLDKKTLKVGNMTWPLEQFRAFTTEVVPDRRSQAGGEISVLLPRARFKPARDVYLTGELDIDLEIARTIETALPFEEASEHQLVVRFLNWAVRITRLG